MCTKIKIIILRRSYGNEISMKKIIIIASIAIISISVGMVKLLNSNKEDTSKINEITKIEEQYNKPVANSNSSENEDKNYGLDLEGKVDTRKDTKPIYTKPHKYKVSINNIKILKDYIYKYGDNYITILNGVNGTLYPYLKSDLVFNIDKHSISNIDDILVFEMIDEKKTIKLKIELDTKLDFLQNVYILD